MVVLKVDQKYIDELFESGNRGLVYNEVDAFYCLIHIMYELKWREVFNPQMSKLVQHLELLRECLSTSYSEMYEHF